MRLAIFLALWLPACDLNVSFDTDSDSGTDRDTGDFDTGSGGTSVQPLCGHLDDDGIEEWFPVSQTATTVWLPDRTSYAPHQQLDEEQHPGWAVRREWALRTYPTDKSTALFVHVWAGTKVDAYADDKYRPDSGSAIVEGVLTQQDDVYTFTAEEGDFTLTCERHLWPTLPDMPLFDFMLRCEDSNGVRYLTYNNEDAQYTLKPECLAQHEPLPFPTRWGRVRTEFVDGRVHRDWQDAWSEDEQTRVSRYADLWLREDAATGGMVRVTAHKDQLTRALTFPVEQRQTLTRTVLGDHTWRFDMQDGESFTCDTDTLEPEREGPGRPFALRCTHEDGRITRWVPYNLAYPFGWGTHDLPGGWWSR